MPTVFRYLGFRFFFYANEGTPREPIHIHIDSGDGEAKFWMQPAITWPKMMVTAPKRCGSCTKLWKRVEIALKEHGMTSSATRTATSVRFDSDSMWVSLSDGRILGVPLVWFPRLMRATPEQREQVRISGRGLHWESIDEDISISGLLAGLRDQSRPHSSAA